MELAAEPTPPQNALQFIGTATVLIRLGPFTVLTDPNFLHRGDHVHLGYGLRARRLTDPACELSALPKIDLVVLSHFHEDHFDRLVQQRTRQSAAHRDDPACGASARPARLHGAAPAENVVDAAPL